MSRITNVVNLAKKTPFVNKGRKEGVGFDCWGLVKYVGDIGFGFDIPDFQIDCEDKNKIYLQFLERTKREFEPIERSEVRPGDFVAINMLVHTPSIVQHFGIMVDNKRFIHTLEKQGPQITAITDIAYKNRIRGFYRWNPNK